MDHQIYYDVDTEGQKNLLWWLYVGHAASVFFSLGLLSFIPLIMLNAVEPKTAFCIAITVGKYGRFGGMWFGWESAA